MTLLSEVREHIESMVADLEGEDDFLPVLITRREDQRYFFALAAMADETKDDMSDLMFAAVLVTRAEEAIFASSSWMSPPVKEGEKFVAPSEHPERKERAILMHATRDGHGLFGADLIRQDGKVSMGVWENYDGMPGGRFGNAIHEGMRLGVLMPEEFSQACQEAIDSGNLEAMLRPAMRARRTLRTQGDEGHEDPDE